MYGLLYIFILFIIRYLVKVFNFNFYKDTLLRLPLTLLTKLHIFKAGPSFRPMYFIIISDVSSKRALPSISCIDLNFSLILHIYSYIKILNLTCFLKRSPWTANELSLDSMNCITSSIDHSPGCVRSGGIVAVVVYMSDVPEVPAIEAAAVAVAAKVATEAPEAGEAATAVDDAN